ncbi:MAG: Carbohydrate-binding module 48 (Isoamylase N-terminal domain), partial [Acidobacteria bacterium]|nr:Carbohydrate-binding module 48 (Isoamylase N-terminal domain) [Acidobacteriota bacterium]
MPTTLTTMTTIPTTNQPPDLHPFGTALGAITQPGGPTHFRVWSPRCDAVELHLVAPPERRVPMQKAGGYH